MSDRVLILPQLAVDSKTQGMKLGGGLLHDAVNRAANVIDGVSDLNLPVKGI